MQLKVYVTGVLDRLLAGVAPGDSCSGDILTGAGNPLNTWVGLVAEQKKLSLYTIFTAANPGSIPSKSERFSFCLNT